MNESLIYIFSVSGGTGGLSIVDKSFSNEVIEEEFIDSCSFNKVKFINCCFKESEFLGVIFNECKFYNCAFENTLIRKSDFSDCKLVNCRFIESRLCPRVEFFRSLFLDCKFLKVDLNNSLWVDCKFIKLIFTDVSLELTILVNLTAKKNIFNNLKFDKDYPLMIFKSKKAFSLGKCTTVINPFNLEKEIQSD